MTSSEPCGSWRRLGGWLQGVAFILLLSPLAAGEPSTGRPDHRSPIEPPMNPDSARSLGEFVDVFCLDCHGGRRAVGGVVLDQVAEDPSDPGIDAELLLRVRDRLRARDMPPVDVEASLEDDASSREVWAILRVCDPLYYVYVSKPFRGGAVIDEVVVLLLPIAAHECFHHVAE